MDELIQIIKNDWYFVIDFEEKEFPEKEISL